MAWFIVEFRYVPESFAEVRPRHREYLRGLAERGAVGVAGPLADGTGGVALFQAEDRAELQRIIDADPYHVEGVITDRTVREFTPLLGSWLSGA
ncbi:hypothetical protein SAMN05421810_103382 [Amycolatopsis arida]|uniref:YCII-related domain-containing protein n=1 Tax=Amycolatopsis arida TaxID=587909 RepID=A0A1I5T3T8_9PSEU|nr:YciI family protein [Amycolatopsis arida]TDX96239.1 hypothetical protein CLV69_103376 [Amycolatopsis arida]SFP77720.1 hypothetical protein SAMN05421810_103382 [Amycolatopsis arida]